MDEKIKRKKQKRRKKRDHSFYILQGLIILAFVAIAVLFVKSNLQK